jgi:hypothetical protein
LSSLVKSFLLGKYRDFGPTLASEKLAEREGVEVSRETVRKFQIGLGVWKPKRRRHKRVFQLRERRPRFGELIQIDGSPHDWFEGRGPRRALIVFIDDAAGRSFAPTFMAWWNAKLAVPARLDEGAHRPWKKGPDALEEALAWREERTLSKALTFSAGGALHCVRTAGAGVAKITLFHFLDGDMRVRYKDRPLSYTRVKSLPLPSPVEDEKTLDVRVDALVVAAAA